MDDIIGRLLYDIFNLPKDENKVRATAGSWKKGELFREVMFSPY